MSNKLIKTPKEIDAKLGPFVGNLYVLFDAMTVEHIANQFLLDSFETNNLFGSCLEEFRNKNEK